MTDDRLDVPLGSLDVASGRRLAYVEVLELIDREVARAKDHGDFDTADVYELIRAKVKARGEQ